MGRNRLAALGVIVAFWGANPGHAATHPTPDAHGLGQPSPARGGARVRALTAQAMRAMKSFSYNASQSLAAQAFELGSQGPGPDAPETLRAGQALAAALGGLDRPIEAKGLLGRLLALAETRLGPEAPLTILIRRDFAVALADTGAAQDAAPLLARLTGETRQVFGPHNPATVRALTELGRFYEDHEEVFEISPCEGHKKAADLYDQALQARGGRIDRKDLANLFLRGFAAKASEQLADCADFLGQPDEMKRQQAREEILLVGQWRDVIRAHGEADRMALAIGGELAKWYDGQERTVDARRQFDRVVATARRRYGDSDPTLIDLQLDFVRCTPGTDCKMDRRRQIDALAQRALAFDPTRADPYGLYRHLALATRLQQMDGVAYAGIADAMMARSADARTRLYGPQDAVSAYALQYRLRRADRALAATAIEPARRIVAALDARLATGGSSISGQGDAQAREASAAGHYLDLADAAWMAGGQGTLRDEAYVALQRAIAGSVSRALALSAAQRAADSRGGALSELARRRAALADQWAALDSDVAAALSGAAVSLERPVDAIRRRDAAEQEARQIDRRLQAEFPAYFAFLNPEPLDIAATQALLGPDEAILMAIPSDSGQAVHLLAISRTDFAWRRSALAGGRLKPLVDRLLWLSGADVTVNPATERKWREEAGPGIPFDRKRAFELYQQLVAPVDGVLAGKRHVFVLSGGWLSRLPFGILVIEPPSGGDSDPAALRSTPWFADAHALSVIPSPRALQLLRAHGRKVDLQGESGAVFVGFGDPKLDGVAANRGGKSLHPVTLASAFRTGPDAQTQGQADTAVLRRLNRLPGTAVELENMRALFGAPPADVYLGERATETAVKHADLSHARVLAFATHGLVAGELRGDSEPGLVLTPPAKGTREDDGLLTASEVAALDLSADWVILSACNTAAGDGSAGAPGLSGLARAFFHAGARALLVSHWPVRDDVASRLTVETVRIQRANPGLSRSEALQRAVREIRGNPDQDAKHDTWAHPNAWAPFSLVGDGAEVSVPAN